MKKKTIDKKDNEIISYLDKTLTPLDGWEKTKTYKKDLKKNGHELFLTFIENEGDEGFDDHLWYVLHTCPHLGSGFVGKDITKEISPLVVMPDKNWRSLNRKFTGNIWKPVFIKWFEKHTGLDVKTVGNFGWG